MYIIMFNCDERIPVLSCNNNSADVQFGEHTQSAANCIPPAEVGLNLAFGDFERNGYILWALGRGEGVE